MYTMRLEPKRTTRLALGRDVLPADVKFHAQNARVRDDRFTVEVDAGGLMVRCAHRPLIDLLHGRLSELYFTGPVETAGFERRRARVG
ncbi:MAG: hypothetical protein U0526_01430 [Candidatus Saccharibacteria bacterium]|jgi:hypothetical protein